MLYILIFQQCYKINGNDVIYKIYYIHFEYIIKAVKKCNSRNKIGKIDSKNKPEFNTFIYIKFLTGYKHIFWI